MSSPRFALLRMPCVRSRPGCARCQLTGQHAAASLCQLVNSARCSVRIGEVLRSAYQFAINFQTKFAKVALLARLPVVFQRIAGDTRPETSLYSEPRCLCDDGGLSATTSTLRRRGMVVSPVGISAWRAPSTVHRRRSRWTSPGSAGYARLMFIPERCIDTTAAALSAIQRPRAAGLTRTDRLLADGHQAVGSRTTSAPGAAG